MTESEKKFQKAKIKLLLEEPFFGSLICNLVCSPKAGIETMRTNGITLEYDPKFVDSLDVAKCGTVQAHEALHCGMSHMTRRGNRDPKEWNIACDYVVNGILDNANITAKRNGKCEPFPFPKDCCLDHQFDGKGAEEVYGILQGQKSQNPNQNSGNGQSNPSDTPGDESTPGMGDVTDAPNAGEQSDKELEAQWKVNMSQAAHMSKSMGKLPSGMEKLVDELLNPKTPWQELLRQFIQTYAKDDYSWTKPNPRYMQSGFVLPSLHSQKLGSLVVAIDTSGSCSEYLTAFISELSGIIHECRPEKVLLMDCDTRINKVWELDATDALPNTFGWGGGTSFEPVFDEVEKRNESPVCLIYFTDLEGSFPDQEPSYPVLWAVYGGSTRSPFGTVLSIDTV